MENKNTNLQINLKFDNYIYYHMQYFFEFKYQNEEQQEKIFNLIKNELIPLYGAQSERHKDGNDIIIPYFSDENGNYTDRHTGIIGGTNVPKDLLNVFIKKFVEEYGATINICDNQIKERVDEKEIDKYIKELYDKSILHINLKFDKYFNYGLNYFVEFKYGNKKQQDKIHYIIEKELLPLYGSHSQRGKEGKDIILPYFVDENGNYTNHYTGIIGGTNIPNDLLYKFIIMFVEKYGETVSIGDEQIHGRVYDDIDYFIKDITKSGYKKNKEFDKLFEIIKQENEARKRVK